jgi:uncharacterized protein with GYD domain
MPTYIVLSTLSEQGLQTLRANPERIREVNKDVEELGAKVLHQWFMLGPFDFVNIVEAPDSATIARVSLALGARGSTHMQSYEAIDIDRFLSIVAG